jgi:hypothetical protein
MGGLGSGRHGRPYCTVEACCTLDAARLTREGLLKSGELNSGGWQWTRRGGTSSISYTIDTRTGETGELRLRYTFPESGDKFDYAVRLQSIRPRFGGLRWWFTCPLIENNHPCRRRVQKLFLAPGGKYFGCRHCNRLTYVSRREDAKTRALTKTQKIRIRLGGDASADAPFPEKPKGMWNRTYRRLEESDTEAQQRMWALLGAYLDRLR